MGTQRYAMAVRLKDEKKEIFILKIMQVLARNFRGAKKINVKNYSIYLKEDFMFGYLEYDGNNFDEDMAVMQKIPIVDKWTKLMIDCLILSLTMKIMSLG